ncbi:MAG: DEAD/DEAH box helicase [Clostridia bacterium]|nr:DEAD/DEAH box helicase [Clostridia bacterium]
MQKLQRPEAAREPTEFDALPISEEVRRAVSAMGFSTMTEVQRKALPVMLAGREVIAKAPTGTGKTCAFGIPLIENILPEEQRIRALILAPTRELAQQITEELRLLAKYRPELRIATLYGGQPIERQFSALKRYPQIVVATPGRLLDHWNRRTVRLDGVQNLVLDECDEMLNMGFYKDVCKIIDKTPKNRKLYLFSATLSREVLDISWLYQTDAEEITVERSERSKPKIAQYCLESVGSQKASDCVRLIRSGSYERVIIFCNTKYMVDNLNRTLQKQGLNCDCLHGDMRQSLRNQVMGAFREGKLKVLIATDVAARGIDVDDVDMVINYDVPDENAFYLHRIGRTARAGKEGVAYTLYAPDQVSHFKEVLRLTGSQAKKMRFDEFGRLEEIPEIEAERQPMRAPSPPKLRRNR